MSEHHGEPRSAVIVAIGRLEECLRADNPHWRELETLDAAGPAMATVERRMDLAEALAGDPLYMARSKLIEALMCLECVRPANRAGATDVTAAATSVPPDDLTRIRNISAATAAALVAAGVRHFQDIADWRAADVARLTQRLHLGRRIHRENWIEQAALLALQAPGPVSSAVTVQPAAQRPAELAVSPPSKIEPDLEAAPDVDAAPEVAPGEEADPSTAAEAPEDHPAEASRSFEPDDASTDPAPAALNDDAEPTASSNNWIANVAAAAVAEIPPAPAVPAAEAPPAPLAVLIASEIVLAPQNVSPLAEDTLAPDEAAEPEPADMNGLHPALPAPASVEPVLAAVSGPPAQAGTPKTGLARLLEAQAALRSSRAAGLARGAEAETPSNARDADFRVVGGKRDGAVAVEEAIAPSLATSGIAVTETWDGEASVEIVRPRSARTASGEREPLSPSVTPQAGPARGSRFFRALKGD